MSIQTNQIALLAGRVPARSIFKSNGPGMPGLTLRKVALAVTALTSILSAPALAADAAGADKAGASDDAVLSDIIVTARRTDERLQDVPISITVYNSQQLANRNIINTVDLGTYTPSLTINARYGSEKASFAIRGFVEEAGTLPTVGVYFADAVAPRQATSLQGGNGAAVGSMFDLENVQILKGPQGTLFGRNTTGGAVLLVPRKPTDRFEGYVEGTLGDYNQKRVEAVLNVPVSENLKVRFGVDVNHRDGYVHSLSGVGPKDFNDVNYTAARASILANLTPDLENYTVFAYSYSNNHGPLLKVHLCNRGTVPGSTGSTAVVRAAECAELDRQTAAGYGYYDAANRITDPYLRGKLWQGINTTTWKASDALTVKNIFAYGVSRDTYSISIAGDNIATPLSLIGPGPNPKREPEGNQWTLSEELQFQGKALDERLTWQAGGYLERSSAIGHPINYTAVFANCTNIIAFQCAPLQLGAFTVGNVSIAQNNYTFHDYALYGQATYKITDQLGLTAGIRNTWDSESAVSNNVTVVPGPTGPVAFRCSQGVTPTPNPGAGLLVNGGPCVRRAAFSSHKPTWLIDLEYKPIEDVLTYVKYSRGYRAGGVNPAAVGAEQWGPEKLDTYEVGVKTTFHGPVRGTFNLTGFWNDYTDQQTQLTLPGCTAAVQGPVCTFPLATATAVVNVGASRIKGIEAEGSVLLTDAFRVDFGYTYLDARIVRAGAVNCSPASFNCGAVVLPTVGRYLSFSPKNRVTLTGTYTLPLDESVGTVSVAATFVHTDQQFSSGQIDTAAFAQGAIPFNGSINPATDLLNLNLNWKNVGGHPVDLAVFVTNATGQKYFVSAGTVLGSIGADTSLLGPPRMFGARLKYSFGG
jgi:iron complex outermembrane receptor protein